MEKKMITFFYSVWGWGSTLFGFLIFVSMPMVTVELSVRKGHLHSRIFFYQMFFRVCRVCDWQVNCRRCWLACYVANQTQGPVEAWEVSEFKMKNVNHFWHPSEHFIYRTHSASIYCDNSYYSVRIQWPTWLPSSFLGQSCQINCQINPSFTPARIVLHLFCTADNWWQALQKNMVPLQFSSKSSDPSHRAVHMQYLTLLFLNATPITQGFT